MVLDVNGRVSAAAYGVPPPWATGIEGAEAWALFQATQFTLPARSKYWLDCLPLMTAVAKGREAAIDPRNVLARMHTMLATAFEEVVPSNHVGWMPAHLKSWEVGTATKSDGNLVSQQDWEANDLADRLAKAAVEFHRVDAADVELWSRQMQIAETRARWIGRATHEANSHCEFPFRDSEASRWHADAAKRARDNAKAGIDGRKRRTPRMKKTISPEQGEHVLQPVASGKGWFCTVCKARARQKANLSASKCSKVTTKAWAGTSSSKGPMKPTGLTTVSPNWGTGLGGGKKHEIAKSGTITWCTSCGCFAETRANGLGGICKGPPARVSWSKGTGGRQSQLDRLRAGQHPVTRMPLPVAVRLDGSTLSGYGGYHLLKVRHAITDSKFSPYVPEVLPSAKPVCGPSSAGGKRQSLLAKMARRRKVERKSRRRFEANVLITSFIEECNKDIMQHGSSRTDDLESESFWNQLGGNPHREEIIRSIEPPSSRQLTHTKGCKPSRIHRLFN